jgi:Collagen triple helix repeat (20 copies)
MIPAAMGRLRGVGRYLRQHHIALLALFLALGGTSYAATAHGGSSGRLYACVTQRFHTVNLTTASATCPRGNVKISWNRTGPPGPRGLRGASGATGRRGPQGPAGAQGPTGAKGAVGAQGPAGAKGNAGDAGPQGIAGPVGPQGVAGAVGAPGPPGPAGADTGTAMVARITTASSCLTLPNSGCSDFGSPMGTSESSNTESDVAMVSPNTPLVARDLTVVLATGFVNNNSARSFTLRVAGVDTPLTCTMGSFGTRCASSAATTVAVPAASLISIHDVVTGQFSTLMSDALVSFRLTTN